MRVVGLDLSLASTGVACVDTTPDMTVQATRVQSKAPKQAKGAPQPSLGVRSTRLRKLAGSITELCAGADLVVVEGPSFSSSGAGTWDRAGLWWLVTARLTGAGLNVVEVPPSNLKVYALGKGNGEGTDKDNVLAAVIMRYQHLVAVTGNDVADAVVLAAMGSRFAGHALEQTLPQTHLRGMTSVRWQPTN